MALVIALWPGSGKAVDRYATSLRTALAKMTARNLQAILRIFSCVSLIVPRLVTVRSPKIRTKGAWKTEAEYA